MIVLLYLFFLIVGAGIALFRDVPRYHGTTKEELVAYIHEQNTLAQFHINVFYMGTACAIFCIVAAFMTLKSTGDLFAVLCSISAAVALHALIYSKRILDEVLPDFTPDPVEEPEKPKPLDIDARIDDIINRNKGSR